MLQQPGTPARRIALRYDLFDRLAIGCCSYGNALFRYTRRGIAFEFLYRRIASGAPDGLKVHLKEGGFCLLYRLHKFYIEGSFLLLDSPRPRRSQR